jgi:hypothetical protein
MLAQGQNQMLLTAGPAWPTPPLKRGESQAKDDGDSDLSLPARRHRLTVASETPR